MSGAALMCSSNPFITVLPFVTWAGEFLCFFHSLGIQGKKSYSDTWGKDSLTCKGLRKECGAESFSVAQMTFYSQVTFTWVYWASREHVLQFGAAVLSTTHMCSTHIVKCRPSYSCLRTLPQGTWVWSVRNRWVLHHQLTLKLGSWHKDNSNTFVALGKISFLK